MWCDFGKFNGVYTCASTASSTASRSSSTISWWPERVGGGRRAIGRDLPFATYVTDDNDMHRQPAQSPPKTMLEEYAAESRARAGRAGGNLGLDAAQAGCRGRAQRRRGGSHRRPQPGDGDAHPGDRQDRARSTTMPVANLMRLGRGAVIPLDRGVGRARRRGRQRPRGCARRGGRGRRGHVPIRRLADRGGRDLRADDRAGGREGREPAEPKPERPATTGALTGTEKVAMLLLALGKARAAKLLKRFDAEELKLLSRSAADLRPVAPVISKRWWRSSRRSSRAASISSARSRRSEICCRVS